MPVAHADAHICASNKVQKQKEKAGREKKGSNRVWSFIGFLMFPVICFFSLGFPGFRLRISGVPVARPDRVHGKLIFLTVAC